MGDYSCARKIYSSSPLGCIHTLEPAATGRHGTLGPRRWNISPPYFQSRDGSTMLAFQSLKFCSCSLKRISTNLARGCC